MDGSVSEKLKLAKCFYGTPTKMYLTVKLSPSISNFSFFASGNCDGQQCRGVGGIMLAIQGCESKNAFIFCTDSVRGQAVSAFGWAPVESLVKTGLIKSQRYQLRRSMQLCSKKHLITEVDMW